MGTQRSLVILAILLTIFKISYSQSDSAYVQSPFKWNKRISIEALGGLSVYPSGKFKSDYGPYNLKGSITSVLSVGGALNWSSHEKEKTYRLQLEISILPTYYILELPIQASDSVYLPYGLNLKMVDLSLIHLKLGFGLGKEYQIKRRIFCSGYIIPLLSLGRSSVGHRHYEPRPPYQVGSKQDTTLSFSMYNRFLAPGVQLRGSAGFKGRHFTFGISGAIDGWILSPVYGKYVFFNNLKEESRGKYESSKVNFGLQFLIGFQPFEQNKKINSRKNE